MGMDTIDQDPFEDLSDDIMMGVLDLIDARTEELVDVQIARQMKDFDGEMKKLKAEMLSRLA
jgi:hypothetical protein